MKYAAEMNSGAMTYTPGFIKIGSAIQKLLGAGGYTDSMEIEYAYFNFFKNKDSRLKRGSVEGRLTNQPPLNSCKETNQMTANTAK
jgi:uncharacterized transporter YbjL